MPSIAAAAMTATLDPGETDRLLRIMARLRDPRDGCPWDRIQTSASIAGYTLEEAYEVVEAITNGDPGALCEELGDLLLQVVFHAQMAIEAGEFGFPDVVARLCDKLVRRHPHVFETGAADAAGVHDDWECHKKREREAKARARGERPSALDGVPVAFPALTRALKLQQRAAGVGFDWPDPRGPLAKLAEETAELAAAREACDESRIVEELGDLLFSCVNIARFHGVDPEAALRKANAKFDRRFRAMEAALAAQGRRPEDAGLNELDSLWRQAKTREASS